MQSDVTDQITEIIRWQDQPLVYIIRTDPLPDRTTFLTPPEFKQQVGFVVHPNGGEVRRHMHLLLERHLIGTCEVLLLFKGRCLMDVYNTNSPRIAGAPCPDGLQVEKRVK